MVTTVIAEDARRAGTQIQLSGGVALEAFPAPPADFDGLRASPAELRAFGLPQRPSAPEALRLWHETLRCARIEPGFRRLEDAAAEDFDVSSSTSAGVVAPRGGAKLQTVTGLLTIPNVYPPSGALDGVWYSASTWIGTSRNDGAFKLGVQARVMTSFGSVLRQFVPFWELTGAGLFQVLGLAVAAGDVVSCAMELDAATASARLSMDNLTSRAGTAFTVRAASGSSLPDLQCNWLVEALKINSPDVALAQFGRVHFEVAFASAAGPSPVEPGSGSLISLFQGGKERAHAWLPGGTRVTVAYGSNPF